MRLGPTARTVGPDVPFPPTLRIIACLSKDCRLKNYLLESNFNNYYKRHTFQKHTIIGQELRDQQLDSYLNSCIDYTLHVNTKTLELNDDVCYTRLHQSTRQTHLHTCYKPDYPSNWFNH